MSGVASGIGAAAAATINTAAAIYIADRQLDIAQQSQDIANKLNQHNCDVFLPAEVAMVAEITAIPEPEVDYEEQSARFAVSAKLQFAEAHKRLTRQFGRFCKGQYLQAFKELAIAEAQATTDTVNMGYRIAEARQQALSDLRCNKIFRALGLGKGLAGQALSYSQSAGSQFNTLGQQFSTAAGQALNELGYRRAQAADPLNGLQYNIRSQNSGFPVGYSGQAYQYSDYAPYQLQATTTQYSTQPYQAGIPQTDQYNFYGVDSLVGADVMPTAYGIS